jgi:hypothetical protein
MSGIAGLKRREDALIAALTENSPQDRRAVPRSCWEKR